ncbi:MAG: hypothetical protein RDV41_12080 [Planctomycetota bacterium]|nr:hypothetical protein [Planctomycetota bacterium]
MEKSRIWPAKGGRSQIIDELLPGRMLSAMFEEFELAAYQAILVASPTHAGALIALGHLYTRIGRHAKALEIDKVLIALYPDDPICRYNFACSLSNLGHIEESLSALSESIKLGYRDFAYMESDPDLENVRKDPRFRQLADHWSKSRL